MKLKGVVILLALAGLVAVAICLSRKRPTTSEVVGDRRVQERPQTPSAAKMKAVKSKPKETGAEPSQSPQEAPRDVERSKVANDLEARRKMYKAAKEAERREREAFMKMSPEEQRRFRERKREEMLARNRAARAKRGGEGRLRDRWSRGAQDAVVAAGAAADGAATPQDQGKVGDRSARAEREALRAEREELRAAALKARTEYEESMGEATAATYRRRSVGYWMNRVKRQRERSAERARQFPSKEKEVLAGAGTTDNQEKSERKGSVE